MRFGYGRCSTNETKQDIDRQIRELKQEGAEEVYFEYEHGDSAVKPQLELLLDRVKQGDTIIVCEVSRLARSTKQLCEIIEKVKEKKICLNIIGSIKVDCTSGSIDPMTNAFIQMSGVFAELELMIIRERVKYEMTKDNILYILQALSILLKQIIKHFRTCKSLQSIKKYSV